MPASPAIRIEGRRIWAATPAGRLELEPSARSWRHKRCWWRCRSTSGGLLTSWHLTPRLALAAALRTLETGAIRGPAGDV